jgi:DNA mismatch repair protein MLH3
MAEARPRIEPLSGDLGYRISSSSHITSLEQVIEGLLRNALDAGARKVVIEADLAKGHIIVRDDGHGIEPIEFLDCGNLAKDNCAVPFLALVARSRH